jgi:hypothetical protein
LPVVAAALLLLPEPEEVELLQAATPRARALNAATLFRTVRIIV